MTKQPSPLQHMNSPSIPLQSSWVQVAEWVQLIAVVISGAIRVHGCVVISDALKCVVLKLHLSVWSQQCMEVFTQSIVLLWLSRRFTSEPGCRWVAGDTLRTRKTNKQNTIRSQGSTDWWTLNTYIALDEAPFSIGCKLTGSFTVLHNPFIESPDSGRDWVYLVDIRYRANRFKFRTLFALVTLVDENHSFFTLHFFFLKS